MTAAREELPLVGVERPSILSFSKVRLDLQAQGPVCRIRTPAGDEAWLVTQHAEVKALLQDNRLARYHPDPANAPRFLRNPMLDMLVTDTDVAVERQVHEEKRVLYTKSFAARRVLDRKSRVEAIAHAKIDEIIAAGQPADLHETFSTVYSQNALCDMIGIPEDAREELLTQVWGYSGKMFTRTVDVHVASLRQKLEPEPKAPRFFLTVQGLGYKFKPK